MTVELLAPAGGRDALIAAVQNGADAVYLGAQMLNARAGAANFDADGLKWACDYCHERDVKVHVTVNTMVKESESPLICEVARQIAAAGADAAIVQDPGVASALREMLPSLHLHASTQMAVHNRQGVSRAKDLGFSRVVLAREMTFREISDCARLGVELEAFAHGALCVSCSGQCLFSSLVGGRSGNRGQCAQPCRLRYSLRGEVNAEGYLLSPKDLMTLQDLNGLVASGVCSLKIEGRLKRPEYVAVVTKAYREALDRLAEGQIVSADDARVGLEQIFNRGGFTRGYGPGLNDRELMSFLKPNHAGLAVGRVDAQRRLRLDRDTDERDSLALRDRMGNEYPVRGFTAAAGDRISLPMPGEIREGDILWRLVSQRQMAAARASCAAEYRRIAVTGVLKAAVGERASLTVSDGETEVTAAGDVVAAAVSRETDRQRIADQLNKTGNVPYRFASIGTDVAGGVFLPASGINALRRAALEELGRARAEKKRGCGRVLLPLHAPSWAEDAPSGRIRLRVQSSDPSRLRMALRLGADEAVFAPEDLTVKALDAAELPDSFALALPETLSGDDLDALNGWAWANRRRITATLMGNAGHLALKWPGMKQIDSGLNAASRRTLDAYGGDLYAPSVELNASEIRALGAGGRRELIVYGRLRLMSLRHCPVLAQLGGRHADCRRCDRLPPDRAMNGQTLVDRMGAAFPLRRQKSSSGCLIKVMNSVPLCVLRHMDRLPPAASWRVILTDESEDLAAAVVTLHAGAVRGGDIRSMPEWAKLSGISSKKGQYFRGVT